MPTLFDRQHQAQAAGQMQQAGGSCVSHSAKLLCGDISACQETQSAGIQTLRQEERALLLLVLLEVQLLLRLLLLLLWWPAAAGTHLHKCSVECADEALYCGGQLFVLRHHGCKLGVAKERVHGSLHPWPAGEAQPVSLQGGLCDTSQQRQHRGRVRWQNSLLAGASTRVHYTLRICGAYMSCDILPPHLAVHELLQRAESYCIHRPLLECDHPASIQQIQSLWLLLFGLTGGHIPDDRPGRGCRFMHSDDDSVLLLTGHPVALLWP